MSEYARHLQFMLFSCLLIRKDSAGSDEKIKKQK